MGAERQCLGTGLLSLSLRLALSQSGQCQVESGASQVGPNGPDESHLGGRQEALRCAHSWQSSVRSHIFFRICLVASGAFVLGLLCLPQQFGFLQVHKEHPLCAQDSLQCSVSLVFSFCYIITCRLDEWWVLRNFCFSSLCIAVLLYYNLVFHPAKQPHGGPSRCAERAPPDTVGD